MSSLAPAQIDLRFIEDDLSGEAIAALLRFHLEEATRNSPPGLAFAMPAARLRQDDMTFWSVWDGAGVGAVLAGCGALRALGSGHGEIKSMRVAPQYLGRGVGKALLAHLIAEARGRGYRWLSLETGRTGIYAAARALYAAHGFAESPAFGDYPDNDFNLYMTMVL